MEKKKEELDGRSLIDKVFSWSLEDVLNKDLYKNQVGRSVFLLI
jgi:senataxin